MRWKAKGKGGKRLKVDPLLLFCSSQDIILETQDSTIESYSQAVADSDSCTAEDYIVWTENSAYQTLSLEHPPQQTSMFSSTGHFNQDLSLVEAAIAQNGNEEEEEDDGLKENPACMQQNSEDKVSCFVEALLSSTNLLGLKIIPVCICVCCVCLGERNRSRVRERERECVCTCVCVCGGGGERERRRL